MDLAALAMLPAAAATAVSGAYAVRESNREFKRQSALSPQQFHEHLEEDKS